MIPALGLAAVACAATVTPSPPPTASPTASPTPNPHLDDPTTADDVFRSVQVEGLEVRANNAVSGGPGDEVVKRINATFENWPLILVEYRSADALHDDLAWDPARPVGPGEPPYAFVGLNLLVEYGPTLPGSDTVPPPARSQEAAQRLADVLDRLLGPLEQRSVVPLAIPTPLPDPTGTPSADPEPTATSPRSASPAGRVGD